MNFLVFDGLSDSDRSCFGKFCERIEVVPLTHEDRGMMKLALDLRSNHRLTPPDAIIGATALSRKATLVTNDSHFSEISLLPLQGC